jgi:transcriptional regulator EpsA
MMTQAIPDSAPAAVKQNLLPMMESLLSIDTGEAFLRWTRGPLQAVIPHGMFIGGVAELDAAGYRIRRVLTHDWPGDYFDRLKRPDGSVYSPVMERWAARRTPQLFTPQRCPDVRDPTWLSVFEEGDLRNIASHGLRDIHGSVTSYVNFSQVEGPLDARIAAALELLIPHVHLALTRILKAPSAREEPVVSIDMLTPRQRDVLKWLAEGKTNAEIATILNRSENTVKHHVSEVFRKLDVQNRAQAVAKALGADLLG